MMTMLITSLLLAVLFAGIATWRVGEIPDSVSALVYLLRRRWQWAWSVWLALVTVLLAPSLVSAMPTVVSQLAADAMVVCLAMVAAVPLLKGYHNKVHYGLGIAAGLLSQLCVYIICPWWLLVWVVYLGLIIHGISLGYEKENWYDHKGVFIAEALCAAALYGSLFTFLLD